MLICTCALCSLENFKFFDVTHVGRLCPKLVSLKLSNILSYCRYRAENQQDQDYNHRLKILKKIEINLIWNRRAENQREKVFRNLEELYIFNTRWWGWCWWCWWWWWWWWWRWWRWQRWGSITEGMLRQLLSSTRLRIVNLQLVNSLTDELFKVKFKIHRNKYKTHTATNTKHTLQQIQNTLPCNYYRIS